MADSIIHLHDVTCSYDGTPVLRNVSLDLPRGQFAGIIGPSGAGKTTLLRSMLGLAPRVEGEVVVNGRTVTEGNPPPGVSYVPQVGTVDWHFPVTVENVVMMGKIESMGRLPWPSDRDRQEVREVLERLGIGRLGGRQIRDLSGGQQQRTFLARALVAKPEILILDEPTASVDIKTRDDILHLLAHLSDDGITIVMTTHELNSLAAHLPWVICVNGGVIAQGPPEQVFTNPIMSRTFNGEMRVVRDSETGALLVAEAGRHAPFGGGPDQPDGVMPAPSAGG